MRELERDAAKFWSVSNIRIAYIGLENQTNVFKYMPLRIIGYDGTIYRNALNKFEDEEREEIKGDIFPVVTLVLYFGYENHWTQPLTLKKCFDIPEKLEPYVNDYKMNLFEIAWLDDEKISKFQSDFRLVAEYFSQMRKNKKWQPMPQKVQHVQELLDFFSSFTEDEKFFEILKVMEENSMRRLMSGLDVIEHQGMEKGVSQGIAISTYGIVINMLKENFPHETIAKMVGTSVENVSRIAKEFSQGMEKVTTSIVINMLKENFPYKIISKFAGISVENVSRIAEENNLGYK